MRAAPGTWTGGALAGGRRRGGSGTGGGRRRGRTAAGDGRGKRGPLRSRAERCPAAVPRGAACPGGAHPILPVPAARPVHPARTLPFSLPPPRSRSRSPPRPRQPRQPQGKGQQPCSVLPRGPPGLSRAHRVTLPAPPPRRPRAPESLEPPGKPCLGVNSMSNTSTRKLSRAGIPGLVGVGRSGPAGTPLPGHPRRSPSPHRVPPRSGQPPPPRPRRHRDMPRVGAHGSAVPRGNEVGNADGPVPPAASPRLTAAPCMAPSPGPPSVPGGRVLPRPPLPAWGAGAAARGRSLPPRFAPNCSETKRQRAGGQAAPQPGAGTGAGGGRRCRGVPVSAPAPPGQPRTGPGEREFAPGLVPAPFSRRWRESFSRPARDWDRDGRSPDPNREAGRVGNPGPAAPRVRGRVCTHAGNSREMGLRGALCPARRSPRPGGGCRTPLPGHRVRPGRRVGSGTRGRWGSAGWATCSAPAPPAVSALGPRSGRPGEGDTEERNRAVAGSPTGTGSLGRPGNRAGPGAGLDRSRPGRGYPWGGAARSPERMGSRGEEPGCGVGIDRAGGWVGASSLPPRRRPRFSRARTRVLAPPPPRAAPGGAVAPGFRCKARSRGSPRTARNEGGAGHSAPRRPAEPRGAHRTSPGGGSGDPAVEGRIWGQTGGKGVCHGGTRPRRAGAVPDSALSPGTPRQGRDRRGRRGRGGERPPPRVRARGAPGQPLPLTSGLGRAARARAPLPLPVARPGGGRGGSAAPPAPGRGVRGPPPAAGGTARGSRGRSRPPLSRPAVPGRLRPASPSGPRPPRTGAAPTLARPRPGGSGRTPPQRRSLPAAFPAPFSFASCLLPAPPHRDRGRSPGPARVPRGSRRGTEPFPPLVPAQEAARVAASPLSAPTRVCGAPRSRLATGAEAAAQPGAPRPLRAPARRRCGEDRSRDRASRLHREHRQRRCAANTRFRGRQQPHGHGGGPRCAAADAAPGAPSSGREAGGGGTVGSGRTIRPPTPRSATPGRALRPRPPRLFHAGAGPGPPRPRQFTSRARDLP